MSPFRILGLVLALAACGSGYTDPGQQSTPPPPPPPPGGPSLSANVSMSGVGDGYGGTVWSFSPSSATIAVTGTVTWSNGTGVDHNVNFASATGAPLDIPNFSSGSQSRTFSTTGTFSYVCTNHAGMSGQIIVQ